MNLSQRRLLKIILVTAGCLCAFFLLYKADKRINRTGNSLHAVLLNVTDKRTCPGWPEFVETVLTKTRQFYLSYKGYSGFCIPKLRKAFCSGLLNNVTVVSRACHSVGEMRFLTDAEAARRGTYYLASYPGSGNTWFRLLLEETTGVYTGSSYCDALLLRSGHYGEGIKGSNVIAVKSHNRFQADDKRAIIYIVRNPFHAILSKLAWKSTKAHTTAVEFGALEDDKVASFAKAWAGNVMVWVGRRGAALRKLVVSYDEMVDNIELELNKIVQFLDFPVKEEKIRCVVGHTMDAHKRNRNGTVNPYTEEQTHIIQGVILSLKHIWEEHGIRYQDWKW